MYAIFETGGKQYRAQVGDELYIEKLSCEENETVTFNKVLAIGDEENGFKIGTPYVDGQTVTANVVKNGKSKKITVFTYKPKKSSARKMGHRQPYTKIHITAIGDASAATSEADA